MPTDLFTTTPLRRGGPDIPPRAPAVPVPPPPSGQAMVHAHAPFGYWPSYNPYWPPPQAPWPLVPAPWPPQPVFWPPHARPLPAPEPAEENAEPKKRASSKTVSQKIELILGLLGGWEWSLSIFLHLLFRQTDDNGAPVQLSHSHTAFISAFLSGNSTYSASAITEMWYSHPYSQPKAQSWERDFDFSLNLPHTELKHARPALSSWAASLCRDRIVRDAKRVTKPDGGLHLRVRTSATRTVRRSQQQPQATVNYTQWTDFNSDVVNTVQRIVETSCPLLWGFMVAAGTKSPRAGRQPLVRYRPVETVVTGAMSDLLFCRNNAANLLPLSRGLVNFSTRAEVSVYRIGSRFGHCPAYSTVLSALETLALSGQNWLCETVDSDVDWAAFVIDNVQHHGLQREIRDGRESVMYKGNACFPVACGCHS